MIHHAFTPADIFPHEFDLVSPEASAHDPAGARLAAATCATAPGDEVAAALCSRALADVLAARISQIEKNGHTPAADDALPLVHFQVVVMRFARAITGKDGLCDRARLRRRLVNLAAFCLAFIDRLDRAAAKESF